MCICDLRVQCPPISFIMLPARLSVLHKQLSRCRSVCHSITSGAIGRPTGLAVRPMLCLVREAGLSCCISVHSNQCVGCSAPPALLCLCAADAVFAVRGRAAMLQECAVLLPMRLVQCATLLYFAWCAADAARSAIAARCCCDAEPR